MKILKQVTLDSVRRRKDKSIGLTFITTTEQTPEQLMEIDRLTDQSGVIYFKGSGTLTQEEVDELDNVDIELEGKSKSQRLRNVLFVYWNQLGKPDEWKSFYSIQMEKFIENLKQKLD